MNEEYSTDYFEERYERDGRFWARGERPWFYGYWSRWLNSQVEHGDLSHRRRMLEIGCGAGFSLKWFSRYFNVVGMDLSLNALSFAASRRPDGSYLVGGNVLDLSFCASSFDLVLAIDVLEHIDPVHEAFQELSSILKDGGILFMRVPNPESVGTAVKENDRLGVDQKPSWKRDPTHTTILAPDEWICRAEQHGFTVLRRCTDGFWDTPYLKFIPESIQKIVFRYGSHVLTWIFGGIPTLWGDNVVLVLLNDGDGDM